MSVLITKLIINAARNSSLTALSRLEFLSKPPLHCDCLPDLGREFRNGRTFRYAAYLVYIQPYLRIIITLELSVLLISLLECISQVLFPQFFIMTSLPAAVARRRFPVIGRALGPCFLVNLES